MDLNEVSFGDEMRRYESEEETRDGSLNLTLVELWKINGLSFGVNTRLERRIERDREAVAK